MNGQELQKGMINMLTINLFWKGRRLGPVLREVSSRFFFPLCMYVFTMYRCINYDFATIN